MEKYLNFPIIVLSVFLIRPILFGASLGDALIVIGLSALYAAHAYLNHIKEPVANKDLTERLIYLEEQIKNHRETLHSIKLGNSLKR